MDKKTLLQFCRYYGGNKQPTTHTELWGYERDWVNMSSTKAGQELLADYVNEYSKAGLSSFSMQDDTPASLKALLFYRFCYWNSGSSLDCAEPFKQWYIETYINGGD